MRQNGSRSVRRFQANDAEEQYASCHDESGAAMLLFFSLPLRRIASSARPAHVVGGAVPIIFSEEGSMVTKVSTGLAAALMLMTAPVFAQTAAPTPGCTATPAQLEANKKVAMEFFRPGV